MPLQATKKVALGVHPPNDPREKLKRIFSINFWRGGKNVSKVRTK